MSIQIEDGKGSGIRAGVDKDNHLLTSARIISIAAFVSEDDGQAYAWNSTYSAAAGQETISVQNTSSTLHLHISRIIVAGVEATVHAVLKVTSGTPAGTTITGVNCNFASGNVAAATAFGNASVTGSVTGNIIAHGYHVATSSFVFEFDDAVVLSQDDIIAVRSVVGTTGIVYITINGFYSAV